MPLKTEAGAAPERTDDSMTTIETFRWGSALGASLGLFLICAAVYVLIALAGAVVMKRYGVAAPQTNGQLIFSAFFGRSSADTAFFGRPPAEVVRETPRAGLLILTLPNFMMGFMLALGVLLVAVVRFGLRERQGWALWAAVAGNGAMLAFCWLLGVLPAMRALGITNYFDIWHPFAAYPTLVVPIAGMLAWAGLAR